MLGRRRCVRDDRAMDKLITPSVAEHELVGPQERVGESRNWLSRAAVSMS